MLPLNSLEQRLSLELYRLLAESQPVPRTTLAIPPEQDTGEEQAGYPWRWDVVKTV